MDPLATITTLIASLKQLRDVSKKIEYAGLRDQIADLLLSASSLKGEVAELRSEKFELQRQVEELKIQRDIRAKLVFRDNAYHASEPIEGFGNGPFCSACFDTQGRLVYLHCRFTHRIRQLPQGGGSDVVSRTAHWRCPVCKK